jgi:hypothetical protein
MSGTITQFTPGDIVVSETGDVGGATGIGDNQASPIALVEINPNLPMGENVVGDLVLPQTQTTSGNTVEYPVSGEFGSSSEGSLELAANGQSLVIAGYDVNYTTYDTDEASGGNNAYGDTALAQTYTIEPGGFDYTLVPRVVADISANGTVDSSTALLGIYNQNNPRSVATVNGTSFYLSGQGTKGTTNQGLFLAQDGASTVTRLNTSTDTRAVEIANGQLYVSIDSKQNAPAGGSIDTVGTGLPTGASSLTALPGIGPTVTLNGSNGNTVNGGTGTVYLSPENYFFANSTTLYIADGGDPKEGGVGDGGLQKWSLVGGTWQLDYTLSTGIDGTGLINNSSTTSPNGDTGLIGLTGSVDTATGTVTFYTTSEPLADLGDTGLYTITDTLADTTAAQASGETFTELLAGTPGDVNIRGVSFAPTPACYCRGTLITTVRGDVPVEDIAIGDLVVTASGAARPVRWVGRRSYGGRFLAGQPHILPVRIAAGSLGGGLPRRDLLVSPCHAMLLDGVLVPAGCLVNATSIRVERGLDRVDYVHIELETHDVILAEGAPSETFVDDDSRGVFHNAAEHARLYPDHAVQPALYCAPRQEDGFAVQAIRDRLNAPATTQAAA